MTPFTRPFHELHVNFMHKTTSYLRLGLPVCREDEDHQPQIRPGGIPDPAAELYGQLNQQRSHPKYRTAPLSILHKNRGSDLVIMDSRNHLPAPLLIVYNRLIICKIIPKTRIFLWLLAQLRIKSTRSGRISGRAGSKCSCWIPLIILLDEDC